MLLLVRVADGRLDLCFRTRTVGLVWLLVLYDSLVHTTAVTQGPRRWRGGMNGREEGVTARGGRRTKKGGGPE